MLMEAEDFRANPFEVGVPNTVQVIGTKVLQQVMGSKQMAPLITQGNDVQKQHPLMPIQTWVMNEGLIKCRMW